MTFFVHLVPTLDDLQEQRFQMMVHAKRTFFEWERMTPIQRKDFCSRYEKHQRELQQHQEQMEAEMQQQVSSMRSNLSSHHF